MEVTKKQVELWIVVDLFFLGLLLWVCGKFEAFWFGWIFDPAVAKVGLGIMILVGPVMIIRTIVGFREFVSRSPQNDGQR